jgi:hypothetical protein
VIAASDWLYVERGSSAASPRTNRIWRRQPDVVLPSTEVINFDAGDSVARPPDNHTNPAARDRLSSAIRDWLRTNSSVVPLEIDTVAPAGATLDDAKSAEVRAESRVLRSNRGALQHDLNDRDLCRRYRPVDCCSLRHVPATG